jgi:hypothetical protein
MLVYIEVALAENDLASGGTVMFFRSVSRSVEF